MSRTAPNVETESEKKTRYVCHYQNLDTIQQQNEASENAVQLEYPTK